MVIEVDRSRELFERASAVIPGGAHSNTRVRDGRVLYFDHAEGAYLFDIDGNQYVDFVCGNGAIILGHKHPAVTAAVQAAIADGITVGSETRLSVEAVELLLQHVPAAEMARFANSGTEAVMHALDMARASTGRQRIAKVEGAYHGWYSEVYVSAWPDLAKAGPAERPNPVLTHAGADVDQSTRTLILPFNDVSSTRRLLEDFGTELAAVIIEPVMMDIGYIAATQAYIDMLREVTSKLGIILIFDELLTGFRVTPGGAQEYYTVTPDLSIFGKAIANGFPLACVAGQRDLMMLTVPSGPCAWVGTFNGHAISLAAAVGTLRFLRDAPVWQQLQALTEHLRSSFESRARHLGIPLIFSGRGGNFHWYFVRDDVTDYRSAAKSDATRYANFAAEASSRRVLISPGTLSHHSLTIAHSLDDLDRLCDCLTAAEA